MNTFFVYVCICAWDNEMKPNEINKKKLCFFCSKNENIMCHVCIFETFYSICCIFFSLLCQVFLFFIHIGFFLCVFVRPEFVCDATAKTQKYTRSVFINRDILCTRDKNHNILNKFTTNIWDMCTIDLNRSRHKNLNPQVREQ